MTIPVWFVWIQVAAFLLSWACGLAIWAILGIRKDRKRLADARRESRAYWHREIQKIQAEILKEKV